MNEPRKYYIIGFIGLLCFIYVAKLFSIQIVDESFSKAAEDNIIRREVEYPYRGLILDRHGKLLVYNTPVYDIEVIPKKVDPKQKADFCELLGMDSLRYDVQLAKAKKYSSIKPSIFIPKLSQDEFAPIEDKLFGFKGFKVKPRTIRGYNTPHAAHVLGYTGEISKYKLLRDSSGYYRSGDYIGRSGLESEYEDYLRGTRGASYHLINVRGIDQGPFKNGKLDTLSIPGQNIMTTIDIELQAYAEKLLEGKIGSVVAIEPSTGEVLALVTSPGYDPQLLSGKRFGTNHRKLLSDTLKPLFNRGLLGTYPPGSMFKTIQAAVAMQEQKVFPYQKVKCEGGPMGDHAPPGLYDVKRAIALSSNTYFYKSMRKVVQQGEDKNPFIDSRIGFEKWYNYVSAFGIGHRLDIDFPSGKSGFLPNLKYYDRVYGMNRWKYSNIYSLSIGQGEILVTPLQMANLGAIFANKGYYYTPHLVKSIGDTGEPLEKYSIKNYTGIDSSYFTFVNEGMEAVVSEGSGIRAYITDLKVCGKTSTVQNPHGLDHSGFMCFAPLENPKIAVAVYVENAGWGARAAAGTAGLVVEKYIKGEISRPWMEEYILKGEFVY